MSLPVHARTWILGSEGGYVNDPQDPGGETKYGISKRAYPHLDIAHLTEDDAAAIYFADYWRPAGCENYRPALALAVFDSAVNQGVRPAVRMFQESLGIPADGIVGPITIAAAQVADDRVVLKDFLKRRWRRYRGSPVASRFLGGWTNRLFDLVFPCAALLGDAA